MTTAPGIPLAGRDRELRALEAALEAAEHGRGGLIALTGEAGIGKTRLAEETMARATDHGFTAAWGSGWPEGGSPPLWPWQDVLGQLGAHDAVRVLEGQLTAAAGDPERFSRFRTVTAAIAAAAAAQPVIIVLDDAHAVDPAALLLARFAVRSLRTARALLVVTTRDPPGPDTSPDVTDALADLVGEGTQLGLRGLRAGDLGPVLAWAGRPESPAETAGLLELTGGNPLLVHEALTGGGPDATVVPGRVRRLLMGRLAAIDESHRAVLAAGALVGPAGDDELVAKVARTTEDRVRMARDQAQASGLVRRGTTTGFAFAHGLLREALLAEVDRDDVVELHGRAADALARLKTPSSVERLARIAHHRIEAAARLDRRAVAAAVEASRAAARADVQRFAYESAADLLRAACHLLEANGASAPSRLLLQLAEAELAGGRLRDARATFGRAIAVATAEDDGEARAEAAIGLGGIWVFEHRDADAIAAFHGVLRTAAADVGDRRPDLRARLGVRLAAEAVYAGTGTIDQVRAAVDEVRATGDGRAVAEALSLLHHVILGPAFTDERLPLAEEIIAVASAAGDAVLTLMGVLWRTVDLFLIGDVGAERSLAELRQRADALRVHAVLYIVALMDVMLLIRAGRMADAEAAADRAFALGTEVGDADAVAYYGAHLLGIRWLQGRSEEILPLARDIATSPTLVAQDYVYSAALAALAADVGGPATEEARRELDRLMTVGLDRVRSSSNWLVTMFCLIDAAFRLRDVTVAATTYALLVGHARLPTMGSLAVMCFGSTERVLGLAAQTLGRLDVGIAHLEAAVEQDRRLGNRPMLAVTRGDLGLAFLARGRADDRVRGAALVDEAASALDALGLDRRAARLRAEAAAEPQPSTATVAPGRGTLRFVDGSWQLEASGQRAVVPDSLGMHHLARLMAAPRQDIGADELTGAPVDQLRQPVLDERALADFRRRIGDLRSDLDDAEADADIERAARLRAELDLLVDHIETQVALGGRSRVFAGSRERARTAVQKAIRRAIERIGVAAPELGDALARSVSTGSWCRFDPVDHLPAEWDVTPPM